MSNMKRSMRRVFWLLALCFFLLLGYLGKLVFVDREEISGNSYNSRLRYVDETIKRGDILDREGEVIATSTRQEDGIYKREYPRGRMAAHITGYSSVGKTGVEAAAMDPDFPPAHRSPPPAAPAPPGSAPPSVH